MESLVFMEGATEANLNWARLQMAFTLGTHIVLACLGVGLPILMLVAEGLALRTGDRMWRELARRWSRAFAVLFAVGAVSGTVLSFELGLLWPEFMGTFGSVIGLPFTLEGFAFFLEAIFAGLYLYGWDRLSPRVHWLTGLPIAVSGIASAWFVVTANAWMNTPRGFRLEQGNVVDVEPLAAMMNPATWPQTLHMIVAAYLVTGAVVASYYGARRLRGHDTVYERRAMTLGVTLALLMSPLQALTGDWVSRTVAETQPVKLAAMEAHYHTSTRAPLTIGGIPDDETMTSRLGIEIPGALSLLVHGDVDAEVQGLEEFPRDEWPPVAIVHGAFQIMIGIGMAFMAMTSWAAWSLVRRRTLPTTRRFIWACIAAGPLSVIALEAGWIVTEVGRQPWIVQGVMKTRDAVTTAPGIGVVFGLTLGIYALLVFGTISVLRFLARRPFKEKTRGA